MSIDLPEVTVCYDSQPMTMFDRKLAVVEIGIVRKDGKQIKNGLEL